MVGGLIVRAIVSVDFVVSGNANDASFDDDDGTISFANFRSCVAEKTHELVE